MRNRKLLTAVTALGAVGLPLSAALPAHAQTGGQSYQATLNPVPLNGQNSAGGTLMLTLNGDVASITEQVHGLAATFMGQPFPHVQHIHGGTMGSCPTASADSNHDGVISTTEAQPDYGPIQTTLSVTGDTSPAAGTNIKVAPSGASYTYHRTITLSAASLKDIESHDAVIVVHGLDPATAPKAAGTEKSPLVPSLPLAATAPALCGPLVATEASAVPTGAAQTGAGGTAGVQDLPLIAGGALAFAAAGAFALRRATSRS